MHHYVAFLRGINLGKRRVKMEVLRAYFSAMGFSAVESFIASGNVIFESGLKRGGDVENLIQEQLAKSLGYPVDTFVRTRAELASIASSPGFSKIDENDPANTVHVGLLKSPLSPAAERGLTECRTEVDEFRVVGRDFYWLCRIKTNESKVWTSPAMKAVKLPTATLRNLRTMRQLALLYPGVG